MTILGSFSLQVKTHTHKKKKKKLNILFPLIWTVNGQKKIYTSGYWKGG